MNAIKFAILHEEICENSQNRTVSLDLIALPSPIFEIFAVLSEIVIGTASRVTQYKMEYYEEYIPLAKLYP
jgi:hypothetical protein